MKRLAVIALLVACACKPAPPPKLPPPVVPKPPAVTTATFEPVYRSAKTVQGATASGVTFVKFGELMQGFSTEIGIAADHQLNETDKKLLALYKAAWDQYQFSVRLWKIKIDTSDKLWRGEIPIWFAKSPDASILTVAEAYQFTILDRTVPYIGSKYKAIPAESVQVVWQHADQRLAEATALFYGKSDPR